MLVLFKYIICRNSEVCFLKKHSKNAGYPLRVLGYFDRFWNGKCYNSPLVKPIGLKMKNVYIRGSCGAAWMGLAPSKFAIWRDWGVGKNGPPACQPGLGGRKSGFSKIWNLSWGIRMSRIDPSRGVSMDAAREVKWDLRINLFVQKKLEKLDVFI